MDEVQREYLDAVNKIAEEHKPKMLSLTDEIVWLEISKCLINNPEISDVKSADVVLIADWYLEQFKKRFRNDEISN